MAPSTSKLEYIALGDSVAAGSGLFSSIDSSACDRNEEGYPGVVAKELDLELTSLACSGATLESGVLGAQDVYGLVVESQLDRLQSLGKPDIISLTIGANDIDWTSYIARCYLGVCGQATDSVGLDEKLVLLSGNLSAAVERIGQLDTANPPKVYVVGYYRLFSDFPNACPVASGLSSDEVTWLNVYVDKLNATIRQSVSSYSFVTYVSPDFTSHELCTTSPWIQDLDTRLPFHPTEAGQQSIAGSLQKAIARE